MCVPLPSVSPLHILRRPATRDIEIGLPASTGSRPRDGTPIQQRKDEEKARIERNEACEKMTALTKELCEDEDETISSSEWDAKKQQLYALRVRGELTQLLLGVQFQLHLLLVRFRRSPKYLLALHACRLPFRGPSAYQPS